MYLSSWTTLQLSWHLEAQLYHIRWKSTLLYCTENPHYALHCTAISHKLLHWKYTSIYSALKIHCTIVLNIFRYKACNLAHLNHINCFTENALQLYDIQCNQCLQYSCIQYTWHSASVRYTVNRNCVYCTQCLQYSCIQHCDRLIKTS